MKTIKILTLFAAILIAQIYLTSALAISSVTTSSDSIQPGEKISLTLGIRNDLNADLDNVVVSLDLSAKVNPLTGQVISQTVPFAPYQSSNEKRIDTINGDDSEKVSFDLIAFSDASSGTYLIPVKATYTNGTTTVSEDLGSVSITINASPKIDVSLEDSILIKGQTGKVTIKIINSGLGESKFLNVKTGSVGGLKITSSDNVYIGNIDSNDFDNSDFNVFINANAPSIINLPIEITYRDFMNNELKEDKILSIKTYTEKEALSLGLIKSNNNLVIIISIISLIIAFLIFRRIRKKKKKNNNSSH